jgi:predicted ATPase
MKVHVKELGAIKEGTIDLSKKLNIFCGPNGTGKTYMAYVIYGLMKSQLHIGLNRELATELVENKITTYKIDFEALFEYRKNLLKNFSENFDELFGIGEILAKEYFKETKIEFGENDVEFKNVITESEFSSLLHFGKIEVEITKKPKEVFLTLQILDKTISNSDVDRLSFFLLSNIFSLLATYPVSSTYILPVERNSIFTFSKELSISKQEAVDHFHAMTSKDKVDKMELLFKRTTRYPSPIKEGLMIADDLAEIKKNKSRYADFATQIENELLHGKVEVNSDGEIQFKPDKSPKKQLPIHMTASIIKSLSSLVIYLKHIATENDLIIIDEPEINLHPDNQVLIARLFARLMKNGFRLLISTHSDYIVREFNNLIMLDSTKPEVQKLKQEFGYNSDESINKNDIGVHYFNFPLKKVGNKQVVIESLSIGSSGFEIPSVDEAIEMQNNISEKLFYSIGYGKTND